MKKILTAILLLLTFLILSTGLFAQETVTNVQINPDTAFAQALSETTPIQVLFKETAGQIVAMLLFALVSFITYWFKNKLDIIIQLPNIRKQIRSTAMAVDKYIINPDAKIDNIKTLLNKNLSNKQKTVIGKVWDSMEDAIEDIFYDYVKPERLYKMLKKLV